MHTFLQKLNQETIESRLCNLASAIARAHAHTPASLIARAIDHTRKSVFLNAF